MNVGTYNYDVVFKGNYSGKKTSVGQVKIVAAPITVSLKKAIEKTYNNSNYKDVDLFSVASLDFSGICGEDMANAGTIKTAFLTASTANSAFTVKCKTNAIEAADNYVLTIEGGAVGSYTNYVIKNYLPGTLKIKKAKLALKAKDAKRVLTMLILHLSLTLLIIQHLQLALLLLLVMWIRLWMVIRLWM